jgi:hypothetical protein
MRPASSSKMPPLSGFEWSKRDLVTDFEGRVDIPGASVLPPHGRLEGWVIARVRAEGAEGVGFGAPLPDDRFLLAVIFSMPTSYEDWRTVRSLTSVHFQEYVRALVLGGPDSPKPRKLVVQPETVSDTTCARFQAEGDHIRRIAGTGGNGRALLLTIGRLCVHPESPRLIVLYGGQSTPEAGQLWDHMEIEMAPFLDSLRFHPTGTAWNR